MTTIELDEAEDDRPRARPTRDAVEATGPAPVAPRPLSPRARYWLLMLIPLALGGLLRLELAHSDKVITNDASAYLASGQSLLDGEGYSRDGVPELHFPPVTPIVLGGLWDLTGDPEKALELAIALSGMLLVLPSASIARRIGGDRAGLATACIVALVPGLAIIPANAGGGSENIYGLLIISGVWAASRIDRDSSLRRQGLTAAGAGALMSLAYLTRPEGILPAAIVGVAILGSVGGVWDLVRRRGWPVERRRSALVTAGAFGLTFLALAAPYLSFLHSNTGRWELTAKSRDANIEAWQAVAEGDRHARDVELYRLDKTGLELQGGGSSLVSLAREDPSTYGAIVRTNARELVDLLVVARAGHRISVIPTWVVLPTPILLLALWGGWRRRRAFEVKVLAAITAVVMATALGFFVLPRYLTPAVVALCITAGLGAGELMARSRRWAISTVGVVGAVLVLPLVMSIGVVGGAFDTHEPVEHRYAGDWIAQNTEPDARVMTRSLVTKFYADRQTVAMPYASLDETLRFARHHGVDYIVADAFLLRRMRPQYFELFAEEPPEGVRLVHELVYRGRVTRIFALDPPAGEGTENPPDLGFVGDG